MANEKPTTYYLEYEDPKLYQKALQRAGGYNDATDPADFWVTDEASDLYTTTVEMARTLAARIDTTVFIGERKGIHEDITQDGIHLWDWDEGRHIADVSPDGKLERY